MSEIPVIDLQQLHLSSELKKLDLACHQWGVFYLSRHDFSGKLLASLEEVMDEFFHLPLPDKKKIIRTRDNPWGYYDQELTKQTPDWKEIVDIGPDNVSGFFRDTKTQWPEHNPDFKNVAQAYSRQSEAIAFILLDAIAINLGAKPDVFRQAFTPNHTSYLRLNYYPSCPEPEVPEGLSLPESGSLGINFHTDAGALTILHVIGAQGLEVFRNEKWHAVNPPPGCLVVNLGDMLQVWSNDQYIAPIHRVLSNTHTERFSAPYFFNPGYEAEIGPVLIGSKGNPHYSVINWGEYRFKRAEGDFGSYGEEVQISNYRI